MHRGLRINIPLNLVHIHVTGMHRVGRDAMVLLYQRIEHGSKIRVGIPIPGINSTMLVVKLDSTGDGLAKGEPRSFGLDLTTLAYPFNPNSLTFMA